MGHLPRDHEAADTDRLEPGAQDRAAAREVMSIGLVILSALLLAGSALAPLRKYSWTGNAELAKVVDPDVLLVATSLSVLAMITAVVSRLLSDRGRFLFLIIAALAAGQTCRLAYVYIFTPELIWHQ